MADHEPSDESSIPSGDGGIAYEEIRQTDLCQQQRYLQRTDGGSDSEKQISALRAGGGVQRTCRALPEPVNQKAEAILASHGLTMKDHTAKMLEQEDFDERTLILVMEDALKQRIFQEHENVQNTWQLSEYIKEETDVTEPVGGVLRTTEPRYELLDCMIKAAWLLY